MIFVTDHEPLVKAWASGRHERTTGANQDLWSRIRVAFQGRPAEVSIKWIPSHLSDGESPAPGGEHDPFLIQGNAPADREAGLAAARGWRESVRQGEPDTDHWDAIGTLVRARAGKALALATAADPLNSQGRARRVMKGASLRAVRERPGQIVGSGARVMTPPVTEAPLNSPSQPPHPPHGGVLPGCAPQCLWQNQ